jgi:hypothetical protein
MTVGRGVVVAGVRWVATTAGRCIVSLVGRWLVMAGLRWAAIAVGRCVVALALVLAADDGRWAVTSGGACCAATVVERCADTAVDRFASGPAGGGTAAIGGTTGCVFTLPETSIGGPTPESLLWMKPRYTADATTSTEPLITSDCRNRRCGWVATTGSSTTS